MKIITIIGARPQFIKAAAVSRAIDKFNSRKESHEQIVEKIIHTGQHYDKNMSDIFFETMKIPKPCYFLGVGGSSHGEMTGQQIEKIEKILIDEEPDFVLVYGDTNSTLAGALAASKLNIKVAHVEAGLRSFNRRMPEEINRVLTDHVSTLLFAPTDLAVENLAKEGIHGSKVTNVGDVMYDATKFYKPYAVPPVEMPRLEKFVLATFHRAENTDDYSRLSGIVEGLRSIELTVVLPLHPRTKQALNKNDLELPDNVIVIEPVGYLEMNWLESHCEYVITDSGGVQKEAYFHGKFCITMRDETEWVELVELGYNALVGADSEKITSIAQRPKKVIPADNLYGIGDASDKIVEIMLSECS